MEDAQEVSGTVFSEEPVVVQDLADIPSIIAAASNAVARLTEFHLPPEVGW
jgi:hypothetical protein